MHEDGSKLSLTVSELSVNPDRLQQLREKAAASLSRKGQQVEDERVVRNRTTQEEIIIEALQEWVDLNAHRLNWELDDRAARGLFEIELLNSFSLVKWCILQERLSVSLLSDEKSSAKLVSALRSAMMEALSVPIRVDVFGVFYANLEV